MRTKLVGLSFLASTLLLPGACLLSQTTPSFRFSSPHVVSLPSTVSPDLARYFSSGDINNDGNTDLLFTYNGEYMLLLGDGKGGFTPKAVTGGPSPGDLSPTLADVNGDGYADYIAVVGGSYDGTRNGCDLVQSGEIVTYLGDGKGNFKLSSSFPILPVTEVEIVVGDLNGDGRPDFVVSYGDASDCSKDTSENLQSFVGDGHGAFTNAYTAPGFSPDLVAGDFNGDGRTDVAFFEGQDGSGDGLVGTLEGNGDGSFRSGATYTFARMTPADVLYNGALSIATGDLNGDGRTDLLVALKNQFGGGISHYVSLLSKQSGGFYWASSFPGNAYPGDSFSALADLNGDGKLDLLRSVPVSGSSSFTTVAYAGKGNGAFYGGQHLLTQSTYAYPQAVKLTKTAKPSILLFQVAPSQTPSFEVLVNLK